MYYFWTCVVFLEKSAPGEKPSYADLELRIVQSKNDIENPDLCVKAESLGEEIWNT